MFGFGKKKDKLDREEKEKKKREKKEKKSAETGSKLTADDLLRLDDIRRSLKIGKPEKLPSGIVADYRESGFLAAESAAGAGSASKEGSHTSPHHRPSSLLHSLTHHPPFLPPKKGILKGHRYDVTRSVSGDLDDVGVVLKNTVDNEYVNVYRRSAISPPGATSISSSESPETADREIPFVVAHATTKVRPHSDHVSPVSPPNPVKKVSTTSMTGKRSSNDVSSEASTPSTLDDSVWRSMLSGENLGVNHRPLSTHFPLQLPGLHRKLQFDLFSIISTFSNRSVISFH